MRTFVRTHFLTLFFSAAAIVAAAAAAAPVAAVAVTAAAEKDDDQDDDPQAAAAAVAPVITTHVTSPHLNSHPTAVRSGAVPSHTMEQTCPWFRSRSEK